MKRTFPTIALLAVLGTMAVGCQKENIVENATIVAQVGETRTIIYTVDGTERQITLVGDEAWSDFLHHMLAMAREGHRVSFRNGKTPLSVTSAKETVTFTTTDQNEAYTWCDNMYNAGYSVTMYYDKDKGIYTCIAVK